VREHQREIAVVHLNCGQRCVLHTASGKGWPTVGAVRCRARKGLCQLQTEMSRCPPTVPPAGCAALLRCVVLYGAVLRSSAVRCGAASVGLSPCLLEPPKRQRDSQNALVSRLNVMRTRRLRGSTASGLARQLLANEKFAITQPPRPPPPPPSSPPLPIRIQIRLGLRAKQVTPVVVVTLW
jgi:hypothetical protein